MPVYRDVNIVDDDGNSIGVASSDKQDDIISNQTNGTQVAKAMFIDDQGAQAQPLVDHEQNATVAMPWEHSLVHQGQMYTVSDIDDDVDTTSKFYRFTTPAGSEIHLAGQVGIHGGAAKVFFRKDAVVDTPGTQLGLFNHKDAAGDVAPGASWIYKDDTFTDTGDIRWQCRLGELGGPGSQPGGGDSTRATLERILTAETTYVFEVETLEDNVAVCVAFEIYDTHAL